MSASNVAPPTFVVTVLRELQRRQLELGYDDLLALRSALSGGFGLGSRAEMIELCVSLWAKNRTESELVRSLFARLEPEIAGNWDADTPAPEQPESEVLDASAPSPSEAPAPAAVPERASEQMLTGRAPVSLPTLPASPDRHLSFALQFPLSQRAVAQAFRRLRRPIRAGPAVELDVDASIARRSRTGVATPPVLIPRKRSVARLLLLIDRQGSMTPFHPYLDHLENAIVHDGALEKTWVAYFHDVPTDPVDPDILFPLESAVFPTLDEALGLIGPSQAGLVFRDPELFDPEPLETLLDDVGERVGVVIVTDAGAARGSYDVARNATTIAFARALRANQHPAVWLNPLPQAMWKGSSAAQLARHLPMLPLDARGLHQAVEVLRGRPMSLERAA